MIAAALYGLVTTAALLVSPVLTASYNGLAVTPQMGWVSHKPVDC